MLACFRRVFQSWFTQGHVTYPLTVRPLNISFVMVPEFEGGEGREKFLLIECLDPPKRALTDAVAATIVLVLPDGPDSVTIKVEPGVANGDG